MKSSTQILAKQSLIACLGLFVLAITMPMARAAPLVPIVYSLVDQTAPGAIVNGTITTNGTLGPLAISDVLSFSLTINDVQDLTMLNSFPGVTATADELSWSNFGTVRFDGGGGARWYLLDDAPFGKRIINAFSQPNITDNPHVFARVSAVPEASSFALAILGLFSLGMSGRRSRRR